MTNHDVTLASMAGLVGVAALLIVLRWVPAPVALVFGGLVAYVVWALA